MKKFSYVGKSVIRKDALSKVTGRAKYIVDYEFAGMLYAACVRSPKPRIKILGISDSKAKKVPGFVTLVTFKDVQGANKWPLVIHDYPFLPENEAKFAGETVAIVIAESRNAARQAADLVEVKYKELPFIDSPLKALEKNSIRIYGSDNVFSKYVIKKGNVETGFKKADVIVEDEFATNYQVHSYLEPQGAIAAPEPDGGVTVYSSTQCPFYAHDAVAAALGVGFNRVKVIQTVIGGGFGGKEDVPALVAAHAAICSMKTGKPVKMIYDRKEDFLSMSKRHPSWSKITYGAAKDGKIIACKVKYVLDAGAYSTLSPIVLWRGAIHAAGPYKIDNVLIEAYAVATNKVPCGAFRGFGQPQICFAQESMIDGLAEKLKIDPLELRLKNILNPGDRTATGQMINFSCGLKEALETVRKKSEWDEKIKKGDKVIRQKDDKARGIGVSVTYYGVGLGAKGRFLDRAGAYINVFKDGAVSVNVGNTEMGQGALTVLSQICAETLNAPLENIRLEEVDTSKVPDSGPTVASRTTLMSGNAIIEAARPLRDRIFTTAKDMLVSMQKHGSKCSGGYKSAKNLEASNGVFRLGNAEISFNEAVKECWTRRLKMSEQGWYAAPATSYNVEDGQGDAYVIYSYSANIAEVEVDAETGV
ncbi:MAG: xanthine dehydrogenase family protein, partial [Elusimicrobia bacterium]|nr:xanthine dehydrogenase family protein [Elusimicrobiota bacterium]